MSLDSRSFMRYSRHLLMADIGEEGQQALLKSRVLVVGIGGLGCPVALYLAAAGVGHLTLCDPDKVDLTNLQRQILYTEADCGELKVDCAQQALQALNPGIEIRTKAIKVDDQVLPEDTGSFDIVVDCTDHLATRHWLNRRCLLQKIPFISAAAMGWEGQLISFDFSQNQSPCLACIIQEGVAEPAATCATSGVIGPVLGIMGSMQATSVIRHVLATLHPTEDKTKKASSHARLQRFDGKREQWSTFTVTANAQCVVCGNNE